jgi:Ca-activated chloride channel family protein
MKDEKLALLILNQNNSIFNERRRSMASQLYHLKIAAVIAVVIMLTGTVFGYAGDKVKLEVAMSNPVLFSGKTQKTHLKVGLIGFDLVGEERAPVNLCIVLDKSGSMSGSKIRKAKEAALMVVDMLNSNDIFSLVVYSSSVYTMVPATKLTDKISLRNQIHSIYASGNTALFGGVSKGIREVEKFLSEERVNRVILLSDGLANVGPSSPYELGRLGQAAGKQGIAMTMASAQSVFWTGKPPSAVRTLLSPLTSYTATRKSTFSWRLKFPKARSARKRTWQR